jgi:putative transposase
MNSEDLYNELIKCEPRLGGSREKVAENFTLNHQESSPHHRRSALATHIHRIRALAHQKAVTGAAA